MLRSSQHLTNEIRSQAVTYSKAVETRLIAGKYFTVLDCGHGHVTARFEAEPGQALYCSACTQAKLDKTGD